MLKGFFDFYLKADKKTKMKLILVGFVTLAIGFSLGRSSLFQKLDDLSASVFHANSLINIDDQMVKDWQDLKPIVGKYVPRGMNYPVDDNELLKIIPKERDTYNSLIKEIDQLIKRRADYPKRPF